MFPRLRRIFFSLIAVLAMTAPALAAPRPFMGDEAVLGNPKAKVTVVEYASMSCPHCAWENNEVFPLFKAKYLDTGKARYVLRELLTPPNDFAAAAFLTARCAGQDKYLPVVDAIFRAQEKLFQNNDLIGGLHAIAAKFGLSAADVDACIKDPKALAALQKRLDAADKMEVHSTPTFFINGVKNEGEMSMGDLDAVIGPLLAK